MGRIRGADTRDRVLLSSLVLIRDRTRTQESEMGASAGIPEEIRGDRVPRLTDLAERMKASYVGRVPHQRPPRAVGRNELPFYPERL